MGGEDILILLEFVGGFVPRAAQVLHRGEVDERRTRLGKHIERLAHLWLSVFAVARLGAILVALKLDEMEIFKPSAFYRWAVCKDECFSESALAHHLKGAERLAETHFGVPEHFPFVGEEIRGLADGSFLLLTKLDDNVLLLASRSVDAVAPILDGGDGSLHDVHIADVEPFLRRALQTGKHMSGVTAVEQHLMYCGVIKMNIQSFFVDDVSQFHILNMIRYACRGGLLVDARLGSLHEQIAVRRQLVEWFRCSIEGCLAHFQNTLMVGIVYGIHIDDVECISRYN